MMKLVFLSHDGNYNGGAQKCLVDLLKGLKKQYPDCLIYLVLPNKGSLLEVCSSYLDGYKIARLHPWLLSGTDPMTLSQKLLYIRRLIKYSMTLIRYIRKIKPDFGVTNTIVIPHLAFVCKLLRVRHLWFIHEVPTCTWNNTHFLFTPKTVFEIINYVSDKILVPSIFTKGFYKNFISEYKICVVNQAVELDLTIAQPNFSHDRYTVLLAGAFDSNKGQMELLQAIKKIVDRGRDIFCYLVGLDVGFMTECKEYVNSNHLNEYVSIVPFTEQIQFYYFRSDVLVVCSLLETFGRVAVEAQMCGLPTILSDVGANPERIKENINGLLYHKSDINDLVEKIEFLRSEVIRANFKEAIVAFDLEKYSSTKFASEFWRLLM